MLSRVSKNLARAGFAQKVCFIYILFAINPSFYSEQLQEPGASVIIEILEPLLKIQNFSQKSHSCNSLKNQS